MKNYDYLIVGSGLFGAVCAYRIMKAGKTCLVIDKREHVGGNVYCSPTLIPSSEGGETVINVHKYGAHIFHTSNKEVWDFVNSLVEFNRYTNSPVANYKGKLYNLPFNMNTFYQMWGVRTPQEAEAKLEEQRVEAVQGLRAQGVQEPRNLEEQAKLLIGKDIYEALIKGYTEKQWGRACTELPAFIIRRLPVRMVFDNNYFNDKYQGIPIGGYNKLIEKLLAGADVRTNCDFFDIQRGEGGSEIFALQDGWRSIASRLIYTGPIDEFFGYSEGKLQYRTVSFETTVEEMPNYQGNAVVNYTEREVPYTRIIEHKHFEMFGSEVYSCPKTVISKEYSTEWKPGMEPYYPVNDEQNNALADKYRAMAAKEKDVIFGGRLAEYKYYDMAPVIEKALSVEL